MYTISPKCIRNLFTNESVWFFQSKWKALSFRQNELTHPKELAKSPQKSQHSQRNCTLTVEKLLELIAFAKWWEGFCGGCDLECRM